MHWHHRAAMAYAEAIVAQPDLNAEHQAVLMALASAHGRCGLAFAHRDTAENITTTEAVLAQALAAATTAMPAVVAQLTERRRTRPRSAFPGAGASSRGRLLPSALL